MSLFSKLFGSPPPVQAGEATGQRILVVDDSIAIQKVIELTLSGHRHHAVKSVAEATSALAWKPFDIVITAVVLPDGTGYHICREAKARGLPVILMPGVFQPFDEAQAKNAGADAILTKPFRSDALMGEVDRLLALKH